MIRKILKKIGLDGDSRLSRIIENNEQDMLLLPGFNEGMSYDDSIRFERDIYRNSDNEELKREWYNKNLTYIGCLKPIFGSYLAFIATTLLLHQVFETRGRLVFICAVVLPYYGGVCVNEMYKARRYRRIFNEDSQEANQTVQPLQEEYSK